MVPDGFEVALARLARLSEDEKKKQHKTELDFWTEQLKTQNSRNILSYNRLKGTGIIGKKFPLVDKIIYLIDYLESLEKN